MLPLPGRGLMTGIESQATSGELALLDALLKECRVNWFGKDVIEPGQQIWWSMVSEDFNDGNFRTKYQSRFLELLRALLASVDPPIHCCDYHRGLCDSIRSAIVKGEYSWLVAFLELLAASAPELHNQFPSELIYTLPAGEPMLSRFMRLKTFIDNHVGQDYSLGIEQHFIKMLSPKRSRLLRRLVRDNEDLGVWHGRIGSYPSVIGVAEVHFVWCEGIKPFATMKTSVESSVDRSLCPDAILRKLGIPFAKGQYWVELIYSLRDVSVFRPVPGRAGVFIPTLLEAAGNWAFRPDRDPLRRTNFARNLHDGARGFEEVIHNRVDIGLLDDFIVWGAPTSADWAAPHSIYSA